MTCHCSECNIMRNPPKPSRDEDADRIAAAVVERLDGVLKLPAVAVTALKPYAGYLTRTPITPDAAWPFFLETVITTDGGLRLTLRGPSGDTLFERTFHV